ncbi:hypothetical protein [Bacteroides congonensis]|uniref:exodeoxyribonuclease X C-terminal domain-containing protein n=1 Tax=Bacteroides congonensis TaxID=1871006 RepID=UPI00255A9672|nr:hypothetical protein [Bacteroides congonensis]
MRIPLCEFYALDDHFNFGRYRGLCLSDVLDINPSYVSWCVKHCTGVVFRLYDEVIKQIKSAYPAFNMDALFESKRIYNLNRSTCDDSDYFDDDECCCYDSDDVWRDSPTYDKYGGSWAQDVEGYSDDDIDTIFDGDPSAYWNID